MHPFKAIRARYRNNVISNFELTKYAKKLKSFQGIHNYETCFIIGNGPSLTAEDLEQIHGKKIPSFAFNRIYLMFAKTNWRPTYYVSQDEKTLQNCTDEVNRMDLPYKFIPLNLHFYYDIQIDNAIYFKTVNPMSNYPNLSDDISIEIGNSNTVAVTAAQIAVYMGFKKIYLIGVDHSFSTYQNDKGEIINDSTAKDYFTDEYNKDKAELYVPNLDASTRAFIAMKEFCEKNGVEVYNATRGGKLEVFPRVDLDVVIKDI